MKVFISNNNKLITINSSHSSKYALGTCSTRASGQDADPLADYRSGIDQPHEIEGLIEPVKIALEVNPCWVAMSETTQPKTCCDYG